MRISDWSSDVCSSDLGDEPARQVAREGIACVDDRFELGVGQRLARPLLEERTILGDRRQNRRHGERFHEIVGVWLRARNIDAGEPPGRVAADRIADRQRRIAKRIGARWSEERRVGNELVSTGRYRWYAYHKQKKHMILIS